MLTGTKSSCITGGNHRSFTVSDSRFIVGPDGWLQLNGNTALDYETEPTVPITVTAFGVDGVLLQKDFVLSVDNWNDAAIISGDAIGGVTEDDPIDTVSGKLDHTDEDGSDADDVWNAVSDVEGIYGTFSMAADGQWTYLLDNLRHATQALDEGEQAVETFTVSTGDGTQTQVSVTVTGSTMHGFADIEELKQSDIQLLTAEDLAAGYSYRVEQVESNSGMYTFDATNIDVAAGAEETQELIYDVLDSQGGLVEERSVTIQIRDTADADVAEHWTYGDFELGKTYSVYGEGGDDEMLSFFYHDADLFFSGGDGDDYLDSGLGDDRLEGGLGSDSLYGRNGNDILHGGRGADTLKGGADDDVLNGNRGADELNGGTGDDELDGGKGHDTLVGGTGDDALTGGEQSDTFKFGGNSEHDHITDFQSGVDLIEFTSNSGFTEYLDVLANMVDDGTDTTISWNNTGIDNCVVLQDTLVSDLSAGDFVFS